MHADLARLDPVSAARIHPNDPQRLQRALEVHRLTGIALGELQRRTVPPLGEVLVKLALLPRARSWLHARIARRLDAMVAAGFLDEVRRLRAEPRITATLPAMRSVGYRQAWAHLEEGGAGEDWLERARAATRQLAKRQLTWLRGMDVHAVPCDTLEPSAQTDALLDHLFRTGALTP